MLTKTHSLLLCAVLFASPCFAQDSELKYIFSDSNPKYDVALFAYDRVNNAWPSFIMGRPTEGVLTPRHKTHPEKNQQPEGPYVGNATIFYTKPAQRSGDQSRRILGATPPGVFLLS